MITLEGLAAALDASGVPWANGTWWPQEPPPLPYALLVADSVTTFHADNVTYMVACEGARVELYSHGRDYESEAAVASALDSAGVAWTLSPGVQVDETDVTMASFAVASRPYRPQGQDTTD